MQFFQSEWQPCPRTARGDQVDQHRAGNNESQGEVLKPNRRGSGDHEPITYRLVRQPVIHARLPKIDCGR